MATKLIENIDDDIWRTFAGICKIKNTTIGEELSKVLKEYNGKNVKTEIKERG